MCCGMQKQAPIQWQARGDARAGSRGQGTRTPQCCARIRPEAAHNVINARNTVLTAFLGKSEPPHRLHGQSATPFATAQLRVPGFCLLLPRARHKHTLNPQIHATLLHAIPPARPKPSTVPRKLFQAQTRHVTLRGPIWTEWRSYPSWMRPRRLRTSGGRGVRPPSRWAQPSCVQGQPAIGFVQARLGLLALSSPFRGVQAPQDGLEGPGLARPRLVPPVWAASHGGGSPDSFDCSCFQLLPGPKLRTTRAHPERALAGPPLPPSLRGAPPRPAVSITIATRAPDLLRGTGPLMRAGPE